MKLTASYLEETDARLGDVELLRLGQVLQPLDVRGQAVAEILEVENSEIFNSEELRIWMFTLCVIHSVVKFCFVLDVKFQLPFGLHSTCGISPPDSGS